MRQDDIFLSDFGSGLFRHAGIMGLEGLSIETQESALPRWPIPALD